MVNRNTANFTSAPTGGRMREQSIYSGFVKRNDDAQNMGRLSVWIPEIGGDPTSESSWVVVGYASPFAGATNPQNISAGSQTMSGSQQSYGWWAVPPDLENEVLICFVNGDISRGFWFACLYQQNMNHMVPGLASGIPTDPARKNDKNLPPVVEYNKANVQSVDNAARPIFDPLDKGLATEGLTNDLERGQSSGSARRESPSAVFGLLTPRANQMYVDDNTNNELIRLRTRSGVQVLIHETTGYVYINSADGAAWLEVSDSGVDIYSQNSVSIRAEKDINFRADQNIILDAGKSIYMRSASDMILNSGGVLRGQSTGDLSMNSKGMIGLQATGNINEVSSAIITRKAITIQDNPPAPATPLPDASQTPAPVATQNITQNGPNLVTGSISTTVSRMPTHEPWNGHPRRDIPNALGIAKSSTGLAQTGTGTDGDGCPIGVGSANVSDTTFAAIQEASGKTGLSTTLLLAVGNTESGLKNATSPTGAQGIFQIVPSTFNGLVKQYGATDNVGLGDANNDRASTIMGARYLAQQKATLQNQGIANPTDGQIYGMYNAGPGAFPKLIAAGNSNPNALAKDVVGPTIANANPAFYYKNGVPLTAAESLKAYDDKMATQSAAFNGQGAMLPPCQRNGGSGTAAPPGSASAYNGQSVGNGQCVALVKAATGLGPTSTWQQGTGITQSNLSSIPQGTAIASFDSNGTYGNHTDGSSHAAIYQGPAPDGNGIIVTDQWVGHPTSTREISFDNSKTPANNAARFSVINTSQQAPPSS